MRLLRAYTTRVTGGALMFRPNPFAPWQGQTILGQSTLPTVRFPTPLPVFPLSYPRLLTIHLTYKELPVRPPPHAQWTRYKATKRPGSRPSLCGRLTFPFRNRCAPAQTPTLACEQKRAQSSTTSTLQKRGNIETIGLLQDEATRLFFLPHSGSFSNGPVGKRLAGSPEARRSHIRACCNVSAQCSFVESS